MVTPGGREKGKQDDENTHLLPTPISSSSRDRKAFAFNGGAQQSDGNVEDDEQQHKKKIFRTTAATTTSSTTPFVPMRRSYSTMSMRSAASFDTFTGLSVTNTTPRSIRFQVVIWYIGAPDEVHGKVEMKFQVTIFWNSPHEDDDDNGDNEEEDNNNNNSNNFGINDSLLPGPTNENFLEQQILDTFQQQPPTIDAVGGGGSVGNSDNVSGGGGTGHSMYGLHNPYHKKVWKMHGRQRAYQTELKEVEDDGRIVYVPPVSILNAVDYESLGEPEVCQLNTEENLMRWSCMYRASLLQDSMQVSEFPHDDHFLVLRFGILKHRRRNKRWDRTKWKLDLATNADVEEDTMDSSPFGALVDHVKVPGFKHEKCLEFEFLPLSLTSSSDKVDPQSSDECLQVKLHVERESSYFDRNIIPLLACLNLVAICTLALTAQEFGNRGEMILATSFVEIGIRMTVDSRLPVVGYQIKMQWVLNNFFFGLLFLVIESSAAYLLHDAGYRQCTINLDRTAATTELIHMTIVLYTYYKRKGGLINAADRQAHMMYGPSQFFTETV